MPNNEPHGINTPAMKGDASENVATGGAARGSLRGGSGRSTGKQYLGSVIWRTEPVKATGSQKPDIAVRADIEIPDRKFKMTMSFRRSTDASLPASHIAQLTFILPQDFSGGGVSNVPGILMKSNDQARVESTSALPDAHARSCRRRCGVAMSMMAFVIWMSAYGGVGLPEG